MEGDGMVAVVRGLREAGLAVTLLDGNRQYTLLPNTTTQSQPAPTPQRTAPIINMMNASTQQCPLKFTTENSTEPVGQLSQLSAPQCDRDAQAVDGRYASMYKTMHCNISPTSPPVQLAEFPPQRPELYPGHGNFIVGGAGSGANGSHIRASSPVNSYRGGMCWPDRGSVCSPRPSSVVDEFARSLRKYPNCLSPDRSSEVMERLVNYTQANKGVSRTFRNSTSPNRISEKSSQHVLETKATFNKATRSRTYEPDVTIRPKKTDDPPTRDRKKDENHVRGYDVRCVRDMSQRMREGVKAYMSYPYSHPVCPPTIRENQDYHPLSCDYQNSSNSVNMEIQAAVKMLSKEVATLPRGEITKKTVAVPESPISSAGEDYAEGEFYFVEKLDIRTSIKSIQTNFYSSDTTLKPKKSAQTVFSTIDFHSSRNRTIVSRKTKSQEEIKLSKDELKMSLLQLINEISDTVSKNTIRDELIKKLFVTDNCERIDHKYERGKSKNDKCHKFRSGFNPTVCDYVGDYQELVGKLKHCYGDIRHVLRSEIKPFRLSEYRQLDFVLKDWVSHLNLKNSDISSCVDRSELLNTVEDRIKDLLKNWTKVDFDLKSEIVDILEEIPIEVNKSYGIKSYLRKLVDVLLKRMRNVIVTQQSGRIRTRSFANRSRKILTEENMRDYVRAHLLDFLSECNSRICNDTLDDLENDLVDLMMDSIDCIWCGHDDEIIEEMNMILQDLGKMTDKQANCISNIMLKDLQDMLSNCVFNQTYTILNVSNNSGQYKNSTDNTDFVSNNSGQHKNSTDNTDFSIGSINADDLDANLDRYTNQLCLQINQWLDTLNIPRIQDSGFREVVVNDLAGDIVDRHKYVELSYTGKDSAQDQLEALKYQIFKWINKLVGDENQETISHAENLLQRINSVPVPMLVNPKHRSGGPCCEMGSICTNSGQGSLKPYSPPPQVLSQPKPCCEVGICPNTVNDGQETNQSGRCCEMKISPNEGQATSIPQGIQPHTGILPHTDQAGGGFYGQGQQTADAYCPPQDRSSPNCRGSGRCFGPASPNNPWDSNTFSSEYEPSLASNCTQTQHGNASAGRMGTSGRTYSPMVDPNQQSMHYPNPQAMSGYCAESSPIRHGGSVPVKKLNEDYDEYLKEWVKKLPITAKTSAEEQNAETARLGVYNGIWKSVTKMKIDPNIFGNQYYCQDVFEEEMERLLKGVPQSPELEAAKPTLKAELLQKTLAMNDLIKSTNAPASFKQQLIDNIENNLPKRTPTENEADKQNDELDKQNMADYYILYTRFKVEDNVKATVHQKNFLRKLDEFLNKIKNRHNIADMDTTAYANEIINSFDKIPTPNLPAIKDEADDILLAMEVENWISDIPQKPDTAGSLEKKRITRDALVKKIQEIATGVSCCDNAFRIALKAELPRYLEKIPIQEGTNVDYMIDELANRIKYLSISIRRVSFQDSQNYEEFSRNMPAASSMHEMSDERSSYLIVGGDVMKDPGPRRPAWVTEQAAVPQREIEWLSMEQTQMPSQMRSGYVQGSQRTQPAQFCHPNASNIPSAQSSQVYNPIASYLGEGNIPRDVGPNRTWGSDEAAVPQKRQKLSMQESRTSPNMRNRSGRPESKSSQLYNLNESLAARVPGQRNFVADAGSMRANLGQTPVPEEEIQWNSMEETQMPSQMHSASISPQHNMRSPQVCCPNTSEQMAFPRSYPGGAQQVQDFVPNSQGPFSPNVDQFTSYPQSPLPSIAPSQFPSNLQGSGLCAGPPCCPNPLCIIRTRGSPGLGSYPHPAAHNLGPKGPHGPGYPNVQSSPNAQGAPCYNVPNAAQTSPTPQRFSGPGSPDRYNQSFGPIPPNIQNTSVPGSQINPQGPHAPRQSQGPHASNDQSASCYSVPNNQGQSFEPGQPAYNQVSLFPGGQPYLGAQYPTSPNVSKGPAFNNNRQSFSPRCGQGSLGPGGQMHGQETLGPVGQMHCQGISGPRGQMHGQGSLGQGGQMHDQGSLGPREQMHGQGSLGQMHDQGSLGPRGQMHGQESLRPGGQVHDQGSLGPRGQMHGQGSLGQEGQMHDQGSLGPRGQMHGQGSLGQGEQMHDQESLGPRGQMHGQGSLGQGGQMHGQGSLGQGGQIHDQESLGPREQMHGQVSLGQGGQMHDQRSLGQGGRLHDQGSLGPRGQMHGQGSLGAGGQVHDQGSLGPRGQMHGQESLGPGGQVHDQGSLGPRGQIHGQGSLGQGGQMHDQGSLGPRGQMHDQGSLGQGGQVHDQGSLGKGGRVHDQGSLGPRGQMHGQGSLGQGGKMHDQGSLGPREQMHDQGSLGQGGRVHDQGSLGPRGQMHGQGSLGAGGQVHDQGSLGPRGQMRGQGSLGLGGQMPFQGPNGVQMGQVGQDSCCTKPNVLGSPQNTGQSSIYGVTEGSGQGYLEAHHNTSAHAQVSRQSPTLNQTSQSPGPVSAASQVPDHVPKPYKIQKMASGGVGVFGTSQVPGPSSRSVSAPTGSAPSCCSGSGAQAVETDVIPAIHISTDNRGVQQTPDQNQSVQQPCGTVDRNLQVVCVPPLYMGLPKGCSTPDREKERCKCMRRGRKFKPRIKMDPNDGQVEYHPCMSMGRYPCHF